MRTDHATTSISAELATRSQSANAALVRGNLDEYLALMRPAHDSVLMAPFGGAPACGYDTSGDRRARMSGFFRNGTFQQEVVSSYTAESLVVLVTNERVNAEIGGLGEQAWALRVTQVFQLSDGQWELVHRHADPLANAISLEQGAALARSGSA